MNALPNIRIAVEADAAAVAALHVQAWQWAYRSQIPDAYLDALSDRLDQRTTWWREQLSRPPAEERIWVTSLGERIVGFASTGPSRDPDAAPGIAELGAIYLEPSIVGTGVGRTLMVHAVDDLRARGFQAATLWVLTTNQRARRFYEIAGWYADGAAKTEQRPGFELDEIRYRIDLTAEGSSR